MKALALVTDAASLPIDFDMPLLLDACHDLGLPVEVCSWADPLVDWSRFGAVVLRSPWDYVHRLPDFLSWCAAVTARTRLFNPMSVARWNLDKRYLADLSVRGVPVVPTAYVEIGADPDAALREFTVRHPQTREIVVKPTVGAYSKDVRRFAYAEEASRYTAHLHAQGDRVILQPYLDAVDGHGETDLIFFDGAYSHAIRKDALLLTDGTVNAPTQECRSPRVADADEQRVAAAALDAAAAHLGLDGPLLYGRVDLIRGPDDLPVVLELELCEPSLSLPFTDVGAGRFARALAGRLTAPLTVP